MITGKIEVKNKVGLHARPASQFVREAQKYESDIRIKFDGREINGKSILEVLSLGADCGSEIEATLNGADEQQALEALIRIVEEDTE